MQYAGRSGAGRRRSREADGFFCPICRLVWLRGRMEEASLLLLRLRQTQKQRSCQRPEKEDLMEGMIEALRSIINVEKKSQNSLLFALLTFTYIYVLVIYFPGTGQF